MRWGYTDGPAGYRQQRLPSSFQILNPKQKFLFSCFLHHHLLNHLCKCRFKWRPFEALATKRRLPLASLDCIQRLLEKKPKVVVPVSPSVKHPFFDSLHFHFLCFPVTKASNVPFLPVSPPGYSLGKSHLWGSAAGSTTIRRATVTVLARAYHCPGPLPKHLDVSASTNILLFSLLHLRQCPIRDCPCMWMLMPNSTGIFSLLWNTENGNYFNQPTVSAIPKLVYHWGKYTLNPDPKSGSVCQLTQLHVSNKKHQENNTETHSLWILSCGSSLKACHCWHCQQP